jgi:hypothetical protein
MQIMEDDMDESASEIPLFRPGYFKNKNYENILILVGKKKQEVLQNALQSDLENIWYEELSAVLKMFNEDQAWQGKKVCGSGDKSFYQTYLCKEGEEDIIYGIMNLQKKENKISKKPELHWDFRTRHFYWSDNGVNTVYIKSYPRFGDPTDISIYILNENGEFEPHNANNSIRMCNNEFEYVLPPAADPADPTPAQQPADSPPGLKPAPPPAAADPTQQPPAQQSVPPRSTPPPAAKLGSTSQIEPKLEIVKMPPDGWCQFHSIIDQLLHTDIEKLQKLIKNYTDSSQYKKIENKGLRTEIIEFILELTEIIENEKLLTNDNLVQNLLNIMIEFIRIYGDFKTYECETQDSNLGEPATFVEKGYMELRTHLGLPEFDSIADNYETIREKLIEYYTPKSTQKHLQWGGDFTLALIGFIFNLEINVYENEIIQNKLNTRNKLVLDPAECVNKDESLIEINLLFTGKNHYDSVRKEKKA